MELLGHVRERLGEALLAEGQLANGPDLGILQSTLSAHTTMAIDPRLARITARLRCLLRKHNRTEEGDNLLTGLSFCLSSLLRVPPLRAMISGAASGS